MLADTEVDAGTTNATSVPPCDGMKAKFQNLLRELFQFDCADLDFGIYRIMNYKRAVLERFIAEDLPRAIEEELKRGALAEQSEAAQALESARKKVLESLGNDALDADGNLVNEYRNTRVGKAYLEAQQRAQGSRSRDALEADIYNHLYTFFSRYWQDGDFISKRRYSKKERYAIPYNGEEVYLYWANHDQYYIKTAEYFTDYTYKAPNGVTVHFKLRQADVEQNNVKGEKRFFLPRLEEIQWDGDKRQLLIPFEYRPLTAQEAITYGQKNQQEAIIAKAVKEIPERVKAPDALAALTAEKRKTDKGETVSYLEHHLRQYTRRNTSDFFIHKDLKGFLSRELDFYLKNEVLNLDEMEAAGENLVESWFQLMCLIKRIGLRIIEFLAQIEDFQKMLWEKKKFVTETFYCITIGNISESFYPEIAACEAQWDEWKRLFAIDELPKDLLSGDLTTTEGRIAFLKAHPTLVLDTRHFSQDFADRLLASFDNLDEMTDGLLVHSENWQALNLLQEKYRERVKCIHIDPPYNTQTSGFLYKNDYQHSSWLAMMENRVRISQTLLAHDGHFLSHIDENEYERLKILFDIVGIPDAGTVIWDKRNPMTARRGVATQHEYIVWRSAIDDSIYQKNTNIVEMLENAKAIIAKYGGVTEDARREYAEWVRKNPKLSGGEKAYCYIDEQGRVYRPVSLRAPEPRTDPKFFQPLIHPVTKKPCAVPPNGFSRTPETLKAMVERGEILFGPDETTQPQQKRLLTEESQMQVRSVIQDAKKGKDYLDVMGLDFPYCHPVSLYQELVAAATPDSGIILDYFAGSGTTGHAVINLNREDGGRRKFILVEMADYFDTVLLPRIKKVTFTPEWKDGKPKRLATAEEAERSPRIVKVIRLESYEDALNNLSFDNESGQKALGLFRDDYLLSYMLKWETRHSETLLNVEKLQSPFSYKLHLYRDGETRERPVDLPETFNYLLGLDVQTRRVLSSPSGRGDGGEGRYLIYRGTLRNGRTVVVIWRETEGWEQEDYQRDRDFVKEQKLAEGADEIYTNGDSFIPGARSLDGLFKKCMFASVEV
jgi:adenine-specific DNA-methyltransferase